MKKNKRVSIVDVARLAGVSQATAARVFDPKWDGKVHESKRSAVEAAAKTLGYYGANALVRGLKGSRTGIIALVIGPTMGYFYMEVVAKIIRAVRARGWQILIFETQPTQDVNEIVAQLHCYQVDGVIVTVAATAGVISDSCADSDLPMVVFNREVKNLICSSVYCPSEVAGAQAADFLMDQGHLRFGVISGDANPSKEVGRANGFCQRVAQRGGTIAGVQVGDYGYQPGYEACQALLSTAIPDAIFCTEDSIAMGAIDAAKELFSLDVPNDLSIMGFDNTSVGEFHAYGLTSMRYPVDTMIQRALDTLTHMMERPGSFVECIYPMDIVVRKSVKLRAQP